MKTNDWTKLSFASKHALHIALCVLISPTVEAATYTSPPSPVPPTLSSGDVLNVVASLYGEMVQSTAPGSVVNIKSGGALTSVSGGGVFNFEPGALGLSGGAYVEAGGTLNANGGTFSIPQVRVGATVNIDGGHIYLIASTGGAINYYSGILGTSFVHNTTMNFYGDVGDGFGFPQIAGDNNIVNFYGGPLTASQGPYLRNSGGVVHLFVQDASLGGQPIPGLAIGQTAAISSRGVTLSGALGDGSALDMYLEGADSNAKFYMRPETTLLVTQVPEPVAVAVGALGWLSLAIRGRRFKHCSSGLPSARLAKALATHRH